MIVALLTVEQRTQDVAAWYAGLSDMPACSDWLLTELPRVLSIKLCTGQISEANAKRVRKEFGVLADGGLHPTVALKLEASHMATLDRPLAAMAKRNGMKLMEF